MNNRISVLQIVTTAGKTAEKAVGITGPERRASNLAGRWVTEGVDVTVLYPHYGALWQRFQESSVRLINFNLSGKWNLSAVARIRTEIDAAGAQIIHTQGGAALDLMAVRVAQASGIASVITRPVMIADLVDRDPLSRTVFHMIDQAYTLRKCSALITVSRNGYDRIRREMDPDRVHLIHNGVKPALEAVPKRTVAGRQLRIGMIGHLLKYKGFDIFLDVAARLMRSHGDLRFDIVGEGPERAALEQQARGLGLDEAVVFHGLLSDVRPVLAELDLFLFTSRREGLSVAILEAMSAGLPLVATNVGGIADQIVPGENGFILEAADLDSLVGSCLRIIEDPALRQRMGQCSRKMFEERFSEDRMFYEHVALYRSLC